MNKIIKFYNQNRYMIWIVGLVLVAIITIIQVLDKFAFEKNLVKANNKNVINNNSINKNYSVTNGQEVKDEASQIIEQFIDYCNAQELEKAYSVLSEECKEILYPTLEEFEQKYYDNIFIEKKNYVYQAWTTSSQAYTYKVDFVEDMLATGTPSKTSISDYYTVVKKHNDYKLNINKFVGLKEINKEQTLNKITINVTKKRIFIDYEIYEMEIKNASNEHINLDNLQTDETIYLEDTEGRKYYWCNNEILEDDILIRRGKNKNIEIKFNKEYQPKIETQKIVFSNIILNSNQKLQIDIVLQ